MALIALTCVFHQSGPLYGFADMYSPKAQSKAHALDRVKEMLSKGFRNCELFLSASGKQPVHFQTVFNRAKKQNAWV